MSSKSPVPVRNDEFYKQLMVESMALLLQHYPHSSRPSVRKNFLHGCTTRVLETMLLDKNLSDELLNEVREEINDRQENPNG